MPCNTSLHCSAFLTPGFFRHLQNEFETGLDLLCTATLVVTFGLRFELNLLAVIVEGIPLSWRGFRKVAPCIPCMSALLKESQHAREAGLLDLDVGLLAEPSKELPKHAVLCANAESPRQIRQTPAALSARCSRWGGG